MNPRGLLVAVVGFGVVLRFVGLEHHVFWHDEVYTTFFISGYQASDWKAVLFTGEVLDVQRVVAFQHVNPDKGLWDTVLGLAHDEPQHPPLYYLLLRVWVGVFGEGVGAIRSLSAVASVFALPAMYGLARELGGTPRTAWTAAALLAVSPFFVLYAQEAREYALWSVLILLASTSLVRAHHRGGAWWALYTASITLALYTSFSTAAVIGAHLVFVAATERGPTRPAGAMIAALAASAALFLPWAWMLWSHFDAFTTSMAWAGAIVVPRAELLATLALSLSRPVVDLWSSLDSLFAIVGVTATCAMIGLALLDLRRTSPGARALILALIVVPIALLLGPDLLFGGIRSLSTRYLTPVLLAVVLALAFAVGERRWPATALLVALGAASCLWNASQPTVWTKGISAGLPAIAARINAADRPLVIGTMEQHHPGNVLALCRLLEPGTQVQFLGPHVEYALPEGRDVFLYAPIVEPRLRMEAREHARAELVYEDAHASLWRVLR